MLGTTFRGEVKMKRYFMIIIVFYTAIGALVGYFIPFISLLIAIEVSTAIGFLVAFILMIFYGGNSRKETAK